MGFHGIWQPKQERNNVNMFIQNTFNYESIVFDHSSSQMLETLLWNYSKYYCLISNSSLYLYGLFSEEH